MTSLIRTMSAVVSFYVLISISCAQTINNDLITVTPVGNPPNITGFRLSDAHGEIVVIKFGSVGNITARRVEGGKSNGAQQLRFSELTAKPTPSLGTDSYVTVTLYENDPFPEVSFRLNITAFDRAAWEKENGEVPFHFLTCSLPGAEVFHQRGWPIATPAIEEYPLHLAKGGGRQVVSFWSHEWTNVPPLGACPMPTVGLWKMSEHRYIGYDFHGARLTDHSEKLIGTGYCWKHRSARQFIFLSWPYARAYRELRYPDDANLPTVVSSHFRLLHSNNIAGDDDPNLFVTEFIWKHYSDLLPAAPELNDLSWLPGNMRPGGFGKPGLGRLYHVDGENARWMKPGSITAHGVGYFSPIDYIYETNDKAAIARLKEDINFLLPHATKLEIAGDRCVYWRKPVEGDGAEFFGPGVPTLHNIQGWGVGLALLDTYRNDPKNEARLLPYIDGVLRYTKHIGYTRNGYPDVPAAQFAWGAAPVATFCLRYYYTFRNDAERKDLAGLAIKLARTMTYRYLAIWTSDSDEMDDIDSSFFMEPNAGHSWLGSACSNEVWVVCVALVEVYTATGDPVLGYYLRGMLERWHELYRDAYADSITAYRSSSLTERYGLFQECAQGKGVRGDFGGIWGGFEQLSWPIGTTIARVICGEEAAMAFNKDGLHTNITDYRYYGNGDCSFTVIPAGVKRDETTEFDIMVTFPFFDLRGKKVRLHRAGQAPVAAKVTSYNERPDTITISGVRYGDIVAIGKYDKTLASKPCRLAKVRRMPEESVIRSGDFSIINLAAAAQSPIKRDWNDLESYAGLEPGRRVIFGVPFEIISPPLNKSMGAVKDREVTITPPMSSQNVFFLVSGVTDRSQLVVTYTDGKRESVDLTGAVPVLRGWPPIFSWHIDLVSVETGGRVIVTVEPKELLLFAITATSRSRQELAETFTLLNEKRERILAEKRAIGQVAELKSLFDRFAGRVALLPAPGTSSSPERSPVFRILQKAGVAKAVTLITPQQLVNHDAFNAEKYWIALNLAGERYYQSVLKENDADEALTRYVQEGGTLVSLTSQPFPFYYNERGKVVVSSPKFGFPICGSGARDRLGSIKEENIRGWEDPPRGHTFTFYRNKEQAILTSVPDSFPFPDKGDDRWRPIVNVVGEKNIYIPLLILKDETGESYGDGAAVIDYRSGKFRGGRVVYVWCTLVTNPDFQAPIISDIFRYLLTDTISTPKHHICRRTNEKITIDGKLDEPAWQRAKPIPLVECVGRDGPPPEKTDAKMLWDDNYLYVAFICEDTDIYATITKRDEKLWTENEVVESFIDPDGNGKPYREFQINPLNTVIDIDIHPPEDKVPWEKAVSWNAEGWKTAVVVDGTLDNRDDIDRGWTVEMAFPFKCFTTAKPNPPRIGDMWRLNLYRYERSKPIGEGYILVTWSETRKHFHEPERFGRVYFGGDPTHDDFSLYRPVSDGRPMWRPLAGRWEVKDDVYIGRDCLTGGWQAVGSVGGSPDWTDYKFRARFRIIERGSDHRDGAWFGFRHTDTSNSYSLNFNASDIRLHKVSQGTATGDSNMLARADWKPDNKWHEVEITARGAHITASLDGRKVIDVTDKNHLGKPPLMKGGIVLSARRWEESKGHTVVAFDDIEIDLLQ